MLSGLESSKGCACTTKCVHPNTDLRRMHVAVHGTNVFSVGRLLGYCFLWSLPDVGTYPHRTNIRTGICHELFVNRMSCHETCDFAHRCCGQFVLLAQSRHLCRLFSQGRNGVERGGVLMFSWIDFLVIFFFAGSPLWVPKILEPISSKTCHLYEKMRQEFGALGFAVLSLILDLGDQAAWAVWAC